MEKVEDFDLSNTGRSVKTDFQGLPTFFET